MTAAEDVELDEEDRSQRPTTAVVGSHREEEEVFGKAYDPRTITPHLELRAPVSRARSGCRVASVLVFTLTQLAIPLIIRFAIDNGMAQGADGTVLGWCMAAFLAVIVDQLWGELSAGIWWSARSPSTCCSTCAAP